MLLTEMIITELKFTSDELIILKSILNKIDTDSIGFNNRLKFLDNEIELIKELKETLKETQ